MRSNWVKDKATKQTLDAAEVERILRGYIATTFENGLYCRIDDRGDPVVQVAPPLICGQAEFDEMEQILRHVLTEARPRSSRTLSCRTGTRSQ